MHSRYDYCADLSNNSAQAALQILNDATEGCKVLRELFGVHVDDVVVQLAHYICSGLEVCEDLLHADCQCLALQGVGQ